MSRELRDLKKTRRSFLRDLAAVGGVAAVAGSAGADVAAPQAAAITEAKPRGYRATAHVKKYYDKARI